MGTTRLPFPDGSFDLVVLNGVLEWVPISGTGNPRDNQRDLLREIWRILRPQGCVYIGIENRFGAGYFKGRPEEHTKLPYISLLPRFLGRLYHWLKLKKPYRTYTHSAGGLVRLLRNSGFARTDLYSPYPDYREFVSMVNLQNRKWIRSSFHPHSFFGKIQFFFARNTGLLKWCANSFGAMGYKTLPAFSFLDRWRVELTEKFPALSHLNILSYDLNANAIVHVLLANGVDEYMLTLPLDRQGSRRIQMGIQNRRALVVLLHMKGTDAPWIVFDEGEKEKLPFIVERFCPARPAAELLLAMPSRRQVVLESSLSWLIKFHAMTMERGVCCVDEMLGPDWKLLTDVLPPDVRTLYVSAVERMLLAPLARCAVHGDFRFHNILTDKQGVVAQVIDFEFCMIQGLPLWDVFTLLLNERFESGSSWSDAFEWIMQQVLDDSFLDKEVAQYMIQLGLTKSDSLAALVTLPILHLKQKRDIEASDSCVITTNLGPVLKQLCLRIRETAR